MGDGHAAMGDGEVAGTGIEIPMRVRLQVNVIKGKAIRWPRFENEEYIMAVGAYRHSTMRSASPSPSWSAGCTPTTRFRARRLRAAFKGRKNPSSGDGGPNYVVIAQNPQEIPAATQKVAAWRDETERGPLG